MVKVNNKVKSQAQERRVAKELQADTVIASGALWGSKGDVRSGRFLIECKTTSKDYYSLTVDTWNKISKEALKDGMRIPIMQIELSGGKERIVIINIHDFLSLGLDSFNCVMSEQPLFLDTKSYRISTLVLKPPQGFYSKYPYFIREDIKFIDFRLHLVIIKWDDFLFMIKEYKI